MPVLLPIESERVKRRINLSSLGRMDAEFLLGQVREEITAELILEHRNQDRPPDRNIASGIMVDRKHYAMTEQDSARLARQNPRSTIVGLDKRVAIFYQSKTDLFQPVLYAWRAIRAAWSRVSGKAHRSMYVWCEDGANPARNRKFPDPGPVYGWLDKASSRDVSVTILGPTVKYRRFLIYNRQGKGQATKFIKLSGAFARPGRKELDRWKFVDPRKSTKVARIGRTSEYEWARRGRSSIVVGYRSRGKKWSISSQVAKAIQELVKAQVKAKYRDVWVSYHFVRSKEPLEPKGGANIPALYLAPKGRKKPGVI